MVAGQITGLRIDHPDGIFDPREYFHRLQKMAVEAPNGRADPFDVVAEKILSSGESLRSDWPIAGTTGYGFLNQVSGLFVDGRHARRLHRVYTHLIGRQETFEEVVYQSKRTIMLTAMASELNVLAHALNRISERDRRRRDFTLNSCRTVLREVIACFRVYRTYVNARGVDSIDCAGGSRSDQACAPPQSAGGSIHLRVSRGDSPDSGRSMLFPRRRSAPGAIAVRDEGAAAFGAGPGQGVEDTAFYRYNVLISANDVGGHFGRLGITPAEFHEAKIRRRQSWRNEMLTTATHDTKRGEDARMRINVLSEIPEAWRRAVGVDAHQRTASLEAGRGLGAGPE
jgi:(1->4)-alpha-D-glucan 1-alpha-D-glucosylmutase